MAAHVWPSIDHRRPSLAATAPTPTPEACQRSRRSTPSLTAAALVCAALGILLLHGYHPYSVDASIYIAGVQKALHPSLFASDGVMVVTQTRFTVFPQLIAALVWLLHLPLAAVLLLCYVGCSLAFVAGCRELARQLFASEYVRWYATLLPAACFTMPVTATALLLMDPYLTPRSFSTPLSLFCVAALLRRRWAQAAVLILLTLPIHPQMGIYLAGFSLIYALIARRSLRVALVACGVGFALCGLAWLVTLHTPVTQSYRTAILSRPWFFLSGWHWYEWVGLLGPLALLALAALHAGTPSRMRQLCLACLLVGGTSLLVSLCFVHFGGPYFLARVQPLRSFHMIYLVGAVLFSGFLAQRIRPAALAVALLVLTAAGLYLADRATYPASAHLELPAAVRRTPLDEAYLWIRTNTPPDSLFAADPGWIYSLGEGLPGFRAFTRRSTLDDLKDEGSASLFPSIATQWRARASAEADLNALSDGAREQQLSRWGVGWLLLSSHAHTALSCPYRNSVMAVCQLPSAAQARSSGE